jgi:hypothetical protein
MACIEQFKLDNINKVIISSNILRDASNMSLDVVIFLSAKFPDINFWDYILQPLYSVNDYKYDENFDEDGDEESVIKSQSISMIKYINLVYLDEIIYVNCIRVMRRFTIYIITGEQDIDATKQLFKNLVNHVESMDYKFYEDSFICSLPEEVL